MKKLIQFLTLVGLASTLSATNAVAGEVSAAIELYAEAAEKIMQERPEFKDSQEAGISMQEPGKQMWYMTEVDGKGIVFIASCGSESGCTFSVAGQVWTPEGGVGLTSKNSFNLEPGEEVEHFLKDAQWRETEKGWKFSAEGSKLFVINCNRKDGANLLFA